MSAGSNPACLWLRFPDANQATRTVVVAGGGSKRSNGFVHIYADVAQQAVQLILPVLGTAGCWFNPNRRLQGLAIIRETFTSIIIQQVAGTAGVPFLHQGSGLKSPLIC